MVAAAPGLPAGPRRLRHLAPPRARGYHRDMATFFLILMIAFMALTLGTLLAGVFSMGRGGDFNRRNGNRFMRYRVLFQAGAVASFVLFIIAR